jgi:DNA polymerase III alpha subunit
VFDPLSLKQFADPHVHVASFDGASTGAKYAKREVELGGDYLTITDHGTLEGIRDLYALTRKDFKQLKVIPGLEAYFRDDQCPVLEGMGIPKDDDGTYKKYLKYLHLTMHFQDQDAFEACARLLSAADLKAETHGAERKPIFNWTQLEELGQHNITFGSSCLIGMVSRHLLQNNDFRAAEAYYSRLRSLVKPGNFIVEVFPHRCDRNYEEGIYLKHPDGTETRYYSGKKLRTQAGEVYAGDLAKAFTRAKTPEARQELALKHGALLSVSHYREWQDFAEPKIITHVEERKGTVQNECRDWCQDGDVQLGANKFLLELAEKYGDPVLISSDSHFAYPEEKIVQDIRLSGLGPFRFENSHHKPSNAQAWDYFRQWMPEVTPAVFERWLENSYAWGAKFKAFELKPKAPLPTRFYPDQTLQHFGKLIQERGRLDWDNEAQVARLKSEIDLLHRNGTIDLLPYFFVCADAINAALRAGRLVGAGRGSAAGLLSAYLLGITQVDPLRYELSKERFLTEDRIKSGKMPDVDMDFSERDFIVGWLHQRFGDCVAQLSTDTTIKLKSAILDTFRYKYGDIPYEIIKFSSELDDPPTGLSSYAYVYGYKDNGNWVPGAIETDDRIKRFSEQYPAEWKVITLLLGMYRQKGRHASGFVISNEPIGNFIPLVTIGGERATQFTANAVEASGVLKFDFLGVSQLLDVEECLKLIRARYPLEYPVTEADGIRYVDVDGARVAEPFTFPHQGKLLDIYNLPEDRDVYEDIVNCRTETVFQLHTPSAKQWLRYFNFKKADGQLGLSSIEDLAAFTALDRPGGLDAFVTTADGGKHNMMVEYARRAQGLPAVGALPVLMRLVPKTYGIMCFQEDLQRVFQVVGKVTALEANNFRQDAAKKQVEKVLAWKEKFLAGATQTMSEADAEALWEQMTAWAAYGFNKSHAVSYMLLGYATAWLKHHYPLEWWAAVLRNADRNEIFEKFWPHCGHLIDFPDVRHGNAGFEIVADRLQAPLSLLKGIGPTAMAELKDIGACQTLDEFLGKIQDRRIAAGTKTTKMVRGKEVPVLKLGRTAIHTGIFKTLVISGAMDGLFPDGLTVSGKLRHWRDAWKALGNKVKDDAQLLGENISPLQRYQLRKIVLPAYAEDLREMVWNVLPEYEQRDWEGHKFLQRLHPDWGRDVRWVLTTAEEVESHLSYSRPKGLSMALAVYVLEDRRFDFQAKDGPSRRLPAAELTLDVGGYSMKATRWPMKDDKLPPAFKEDLAGSVVLAFCEFTARRDRPLKLIDVRVIQGVTKPGKEEESSS